MSAACKVLVVEAHDDLRALLVAATEERCEVLAVATGAEMCRALAEGDYDVAIINTELSDADGLVLADYAARRGCGIIVIPHGPSQAEEAERRGYTILSKPFRIGRLVDLIDELLGGLAAPRRPQGVC